MTGPSASSEPFVIIDSKAGEIIRLVVSIRLSVDALKEHSKFLLFRQVASSRSITLLIFYMVESWPQIQCGSSVILDLMGKHRKNYTFNVGFPLHAVSKAGLSEFSR